MVRPAQSLEERIKEYSEWLMQNHSGRRFIRKHEVAEALQVSGETVKRWVRAGKLTCLRLGPNKLSFDVKDVAEFMAARVR
jgi:excisionase family DNA binding protein